ncbi:immunoglobulin i-set domain-containing protein [Ditylenchus destructor]|nr:immunoglobulin i-set domain-containing protein [Ditylenchus destructor]
MTYLDAGCRTLINSGKTIDPAAEITENAGISVVRPLADIEATEGTKVEFSAQLSADLGRTAQVKWFKDGELLNTRTSFKHRSRTDGDQVKLAISNVGIVDVGKYKFVLDIVQGTRTSIAASLESTEAQLTIRGKGGIEKVTSKVSAQAKDETQESSNGPQKSSGNVKDETKTSKGTKLGKASGTTKHAQSAELEAMEVDENFNFIKNKNLTIDVGPKDDQEIQRDEDDEKENIQLGNKKDMLTRPKIAASDTMEVDEVNRKSREAKLTAPSIRMPLPEMRDLPENENNVTLVCAVTGIPTPDIQWLKDNRPVEEVERVEPGRRKIKLETFRTTLENGIATLYFGKVKAIDSGVYTCIVSNSQGTARCSGTLFIQPSPDNDRVSPKFQSLLSDKTVCLGSELVLECELSNGKPLATVQWHKDGLKLLQSNRHLAFHDSQGSARLTIMLVREDDAGEYSVEAENIHGKDFTHCTVKVLNDNIMKRKSEENKESGTTQLEEAKEEAKKSKVPVICRPLKDVKVHEGNRVLMECEVQCQEKVPIQAEWYHNGRLLATTRTLRTYFDGRLAMLKIYDAQREHDGHYECRFWTAGAENEAVMSSANVCVEAIKSSGSDSSTNVTNDFVLNMPNFVTKLEDTRVENEGDSVSLMCQVNGNPSPEVQWLHNGKAIISNDQFLISSKGGEYRMDIKSFQSALHTGTYTAVAKNIYGDVHSSASLAFNLALETPEAAVAEAKLSTEVDTDSRIETLETVFETEKKENAKDDEPKSEAYPLHFSSKLQDQTVLAGATAKMECIVQSSSIITSLEWLKDNRPIGTNTRQRINFEPKSGKASLTILACRSEDAGTYTCRGINSLATEQSTECFLTVATRTGTDAHLVAAASESPEPSTKLPTFTRQPPSEVHVAEGAGLQLYAKAIGDPLPTIKWLKDGKELGVLNKNYQFRVTGSGEHVLDIPCAVLKTSGEFTCVAKNGAGSTKAVTQVVVTKKSPMNSESTEESPSFVEVLTDTRVESSQPVTLRCKIAGMPEPELGWFFTGDSNLKPTPIQTGKGVWTEFRQGSSVELKADAVLRAQQGTYKCIATNKLGNAETKCYLLIGSGCENKIQDEAGPPRFTKCLRDIWVEKMGNLPRDIRLDVEVAGRPSPKITWLHNNRLVEPNSNLSIVQSNDTSSVLLISKNVHTTDLGVWAAVASNAHGQVQSSCSINVGKPPETVGTESDTPMETSSEGEALFPMEKKDVKQSKENGDEVVTSRRHSKSKNRWSQSKGTAPSFVHGLEDMELNAGDTAAVAGKLAKKRRRHPFEFQESLDQKNLADSIISRLDKDGDVEHNDQSQHPPDNEVTLDAIRQAIITRNAHGPCRPRFLVKPKSRKEIEEHKSLRLKAAVSANPPAEVHWDRNGVILETGNKFSIYNDGDFYYLEVHHVSQFDAGFYNCTSTNKEGLATCTSEIDVTPMPDSTIERMKKRMRREHTAPAFIEVLPGRQKCVVGETISVECSVSGYPAPSVSWQRNGCTIIPQPDRYQIYYDGECSTLKFVSVSMADAGTYNCMAENTMGKANTQMQLDICRPAIREDDGLPPKFLASKQRFKKKLEDGEGEIVLKAEIIEGTEPITCRWIRNKVELAAECNAFCFGREGKDALLTIKDAFPEDSGEYLCMAENKFGASHCTIDLHLSECLKSVHEDEAPIIKTSKRATTTEVGAKAEVKFSVVAKPEPVISWFKVVGGKDERILPGSRYETISKGKYFILRIHNAQLQDAGTYKLLAVNSVGTATETTQLFMDESHMSISQALPRFIRRPVSTQCILGQRVELDCEFDGTPTPVVIITVYRYCAHRLESGEGMITIENANSNSSRLTILRVGKHHLGEYLCTVRNNYGEDLATSMVLLEGSSAALSHLPQLGDIRRKSSLKKKPPITKK